MTQSLAPRSTGGLTPPRSPDGLLAAPVLTPIDHYLAEQQDLSAVERFARHHETNGVPAQAKHYSSLLPATPPRAGQQYAFEVDLDRCSGCKACVTACHAQNGLDEHESWRDVGLLTGGTNDAPAMQHVTSSCHHCLEPPCMSACPVDAYEKNPVTGIVKHLDDQCFGCQYCTLACPYDAPRYHAGKGIVRKCDMCSDRLSHGEAPACVAACPHEAIRIAVVETARVIEDSEAGGFLPGAHEPQYTLPTTVYKTERVLPRNMLPADYHAVHPEHAHWPLVVMLVLTQLSVGAFLTGFLLDRFAAVPPSDATRALHAAGSLAFGLMAMSASVLHLGRPLYAFRAVIGLRHSWLSREILAFGLFAPLAGVYALATWNPHWLGPRTGSLGAAVVVAGLAGVFCSIMIYVVTRRTLWSGPVTAMRFLTTTAILGAATTLAVSILAAVGSEHVDVETALAGHGRLLCRVLIGVAASKLMFEAAVFRHLWDARNTPMKRSALLMTGPLASTTLARFACGFLGGVWLPWMILLDQTRPDGVFSTGALTAATLLMFAACIAGELLERALFFQAVVRSKMPGSVTTWDGEPRTVWNSGLRPDQKVRNRESRE